MCNDRVIITAMKSNDDVIMTLKWVIMVCLTQNPAPARHAASADQSNALLQRRCLKNSALL